MSQPSSCSRTSIVLLWATHNFLGDDAHITFTYSRNLADGEGFVFNANDRTLSTTTPLTAIAMSIPSLLGLDLQLAGMVLSAAAAIVIAAVLYVNLEPLTSPIPATTAAVVSAGHLFVVTTMSNEMSDLAVDDLGNLAG